MQSQVIKIFSPIAVGVIGAKDLIQVYLILPDRSKARSGGQQGPPHTVIQKSAR